MHISTPVPLRWRKLSNWSWNCSRIRQIWSAEETTDRENVILLFCKYLLAWIFDCLMVYFITFKTMLFIWKCIEISNSNAFISLYDILFCQWKVKYFIIVWGYLCSEKPESISIVKIIYVFLLWYVTYIDKKATFLNIVIIIPQNGKFNILYLYYLSFLHNGLRACHKTVLRHYVLKG